MAQPLNTAPVTPRRYLPSYFSRTFGMVWSGVTLAALGDGFSTVALGLWVLQATGSAMAMTQIMLVRSVVSVLVGPISGGLVDRFNRQRLMIVADVMRAALLTAIAWLMVTSPAVPMVPLMVLLGCSTVFTVLFDTAMGASMVLIVGKEQVPRAQGMLGFSNMGARIFGPMLGGVVVMLLGGPSGIGINAITYILSGILILFAGRIPSPEPQHASEASKPSFWSQIQEGFRFLRRDALIAPLVLFLGPSIMFFSTGLQVLLPVVSVNVWNADGPMYGVIQGLFAAGFSTGFLVLMLLGHKLKSRGLLFGAMMMLYGLLTITLGVLPSALPALPVLFLIGLALALGNTVNQVALQTKVPVEMQGRVFGVAQALFNVATPLGMVLAGLLGDWMGASAVLIASGIGVVAVGLSAFAFRPVRQFN